MSYIGRDSVIPRPSQMPRRKQSNLLRETVAFLKRFDKTLDDIVYAGSSDGKLFIPQDKLLSVLNINYDAGYGDVEIDDRFVITLHDGSTLTRWHSNGCEGWRFNAGHTMADAKELTTLKGRME